MKIEYLSHSQISTMERCGVQYAYRYLEGIKSPPGIAAMRGRATHRAVEQNMIAKMNDGALLPLDQVRQAAADAFVSEVRGSEVVIDGDFSGMSVEAALGIAKDQAVNLAGLHAEEVAPQIQPTAVEVRIRIPESDVLPVALYGVIDIVDRDVIVRDTKTSGKAPSAVNAALSSQLSAYALLQTARTGSLPEKLVLDTLVQTKGGKKSPPKRYSVTHETTRGMADLEAYVQRARRVAEAVEKEVFMPAPMDSWACSERFCGYWNICPFGAQGRSTAARMEEEE